MRNGELERCLMCAGGAGVVLCALGAAYGLAAWGSWPAARFLLVYVAPMCVAVPWWARERLRAAAHGSGDTPVRLLLDAAVVVLAIARFGIGDALPFSGHMLFLTYSLLTTRARGYQLAALLLLLESTIFKLLVWQDTRSWAVGLMLGLVAAVVARGAGARCGR